MYFKHLSSVIWACRWQYQNRDSHCSQGSSPLRWRPQHRFGHIISYIKVSKFHNSDIVYLKYEESWLDKSSLQNITLYNKNVTSDKYYLKPPGLTAPLSNNTLCMIAQLTPNNLDLTFQCHQGQMSWGKLKTIYMMCFMQNAIQYDTPFRRYLLKII